VQICPQKAFLNKNATINTAIIIIKFVRASLLSINPYPTNEKSDSIAPKGQNASTP
jgi:hypothetical protein